MEKSKKFLISVNFYDVKDEKVIMKGTAFVDNQNNSFEYLKSQGRFKLLVNYWIKIFSKF